MVRYIVTYLEKKTATITAGSMEEADRMARGVWNEATEYFEGGAWSEQNGFKILGIEKIIRIPPVDPTPAQRMLAPSSLVEELEEVKTA